jgi:hypothetical protein
VPVDADGELAFVDAAASLVNLGERSDPGPGEHGWIGCAAAARGVMWLHPDGSLRWARCGRSNSCWYCARLSALENLVVLELDARHHSAPTVGMTLTTSAARTDDGELRRSVEQVTKALRRRWRELEYLAFVEWTTGRASTSGGHRRVHVHVLLKELPVDDVDEAEAIVKRVWKARTGAHRVEVRELRKAGGATAYLALHHRKQSQGPPAGWTGKRFRPSRGYFGGVGEVGKLRARAHELIAERRAIAAAEHELEREFLSAGAATESVELVETAGGQLRERRLVDVIAGDVWDDWLVDRLEYELRRGAAARPLLVRVRHRDVVDERTGECRRVVVEVLGPAKSSSAAAGTLAA